MKSSVYLLFALLVASTSFAQKQVESTNQFEINGLVDKPKTISFSDLQKEPFVEIKNFKITNHAGEFRKEYKNIKAVALLPLLKDVTITTLSPKLLSEYCLVLKASDGYSAVVSWNELFNTEIGASFFLVIEADGKSQAESTECILLIATKDFKTGRRHIKGLQSIEIKRV
jgi:hypothetical protein